MHACEDNLKYTKTTRILKMMNMCIACALLIRFWNHELDTCTKTTRILKIWNVYVACALLIHFWNDVLGACVDRSLEIHKDCEDSKILNMYIACALLIQF